MSATTTDVLVVGGGIVGTFHAYFAAQKGYRTLLLERNAAPNKASIQNFGMVATGTIAAPGEWQSYARVTNQLYRQLAATYDIDLTLRKTGTLYLVEKPLEVQLLKELAAIKTANGESAEFLSQTEVLKEHPYARPEYVKAGLWLPDDMAVDPRQFIHHLQTQFERDGIFQYQRHTYITHIASNQHHHTLTDNFGNTYQAKHVIVCSGIEYQTLFPKLFQEHGLKTCKLYMLQTHPQPTIKLPHNILSGLSLRRYPAFSICPSYDAFMQSEMGATYKKYGIHLLFKQADDGSVIIGDSHEYFATTENIPFDIEDHIADAILEYGRRMIHLDTWKIRQTWYGLYSTYPKGEVFTAEVAENLHIATGIAGKGISTGAGFAKANIDKIL